MKSLAFLFAMLGGFAFLVHQFSFWSVVGVAYLAAMTLVVLLAFIPRRSSKGLKQV